MTPNAEQMPVHHKMVDGEVWEYLTYFWAPSWRFPACFRLLSLGLLPALVAGLGCCFPIPGIVFPVEPPSALEPPFTIAVAIVKDRPGLVPGRSTPRPGARDRECVVGLFLSMVSRRSLKGWKFLGGYVGKEGLGQWKIKSDEVESGC